MMEKRQQNKNTVKFLLALSVWCILTAAWVVVWHHSYAMVTVYPREPFGYKGNLLIYAVYGILSVLFTGFYGGYRIGHFTKANVTLSSGIASVFTNTVMYLILCLVARAVVIIPPMLVLSAVDVLVVIAWSNIATQIYTEIFPPHQLLLVYGGGEAATALAKKMANRHEKYIIQQAISISAGEEELLKQITAFRAVILCDLPPQLRNRLLKFCFSNDIRAYTTPKISDILLRGAVNITIFDTPILLNRNTGSGLGYTIFKRAMDIALSVLMLLLLSPFLLGTALVVRLEDRGPIIYKQARLTKDGREFYIYKFRSMNIDAEANGVACLATEEDARVTRVGKFIRKTRLDELPQLLNILTGSMSFVGPRPERPELSAEYEKDMPEFSYRLKVKAGLTGYAQVYGAYATNPYDKLKMDVMYIMNCSAIEDLKLLFLTVKILFSKDAARGIRAKD